MRCTFLVENAELAAFLQQKFSVCQKKKKKQKN